MQDLTTTALPATLSTTARQLTAASLSENTRRAYTAALQRFDD